MHISMEHESFLPFVFIQMDKKYWVNMKSKKGEKERGRRFITSKPEKSSSDLITNDVLLG